MLWSNHKRYSPEVSRIADLFPIEHLSADGEDCLTKEGERVAVIEVSGRDFTGLPENVVSNLAKGRQHYFEGFDSNVHIDVHSIRHQLSSEVANNHYGEDVTNHAMRQHSKIFTTSYKNRHYLVFTTKSENGIRRLFGSIARTERSDFYKQEVIRAATLKTMMDLESYRPRKLTRNELLHFWYELVNGRSHPFHTDQPNINDFIASHDICWPVEYPDRQEYVNGTDIRYSGWVSIMEYPNITTARILDALFILPVEFSLHQSYAPLSKEDAQAYTEDRKRGVASFVKNADIRQMELKESSERVEADEIKKGLHGYCLQVFGETPQLLAAAIASVVSALTDRGIKPVRETLNQEALYWSRFPGMAHYNVRAHHAMISSENIADVVAFSTTGQGFSSCSFGPEPVTLLKTPTGSDFAFTFHISEGDEVNGNTLVIGGTGVGKTTLMSFLKASCLKYQGFRAMVFDRQQGVEIATRMLGGSYVDFGECRELNPMQLPDTPSNRMFLAEFLSDLTGKRDDESVETINRVIDLNYQLEPEHRRLQELDKAFGLPMEGSIRSALSRWLPGGSYEIFNGERDIICSSDRFDSSRINTFDMTSLLDMPEVLGPVAKYLFHNQDTQIKENPGPFMVWIDELMKFMNSPTFVPFIAKWAEEIRKRNGVLVGSCQDAKSVLNHPEGDRVLKNMGTFLLFPDESAQGEQYIDGLGLTDTEFAWIREPHTRQVLMKRREGESVILDVNLAHLGPFLRCFNSSTSQVKRMNDLRKRYPKEKEWKLRFLRGESA